MRELDCRWSSKISLRERWVLDTENVSHRVIVFRADSYYIDRPESQKCIRFMLMWYPLTAKSSQFPVRVNEIRSRLVDGRVWLSLNQSIPVMMSNDRVVSCFRHCRQGGCWYCCEWTACLRPQEIHASNWISRATGTDHVTDVLCTANEIKSFEAARKVALNCGLRLETI